MPGRAFLRCAGFVLLLHPDPSSAQTEYTPIAEAGFEEVLDIGDPFGPDERSFHRITDVAFDPEARGFWVSEPDRVRWFDDRGALLMAFGREGSGPGEFQHAGMLRLDSVVRVYDVRLARETRFARRGELLGTVTGRLAAGRTIALDTDRSLVTTAARFSFGGPPSDPYVHVILVDGSTSDTLASMRAGSAVWYHAEDRLPWGLVSTGSGSLGGSDLSGDSLLVVADGEDGVIEWWCLSRPVRPCGRGSLGLHAESFGEDRKRELEAKAAAQSGLPPHQLQLTEVPGRVSIASSVVISEGGEQVWVQNEGDHLGGRRWSVVDRGGSVIARYRFDGPVRIQAVSNRGILGVRSGEYDEEHVVWWRR